MCMYVHHTTGGWDRGSLQGRSWSIGCTVLEWIQWSVDTWGIRTDYQSVLSTHRGSELRRNESEHHSS